MVIKKVPGQGAKELQFLIKGLDDKKVGKVGWFKDAKYPDKNSTPVAYVATIQEFGYPAGNIPPRPFMRTTIREKQVEWKRIAEQQSKQILKGSTNMTGALELLGQKAAGDVREKITQITTPPLKESTIQARLAKRRDKKTMGLLTKPLIDTGLMLATLTNTVEDE